MTKSKFFETTAVRTELIEDVPGFGDIWIRDREEVKRAQRMAGMFDSNGVRNQAEVERQRIYRIVDQVCTSEAGEPMFTAEDIPELLKVNGDKLDVLYTVIVAREERAEKNGQAGSDDSS